MRVTLLIIHRQWSENIFGARYAKEIAGILSDYTKYNSRRKPELLSPETYSLTNYLEAESIEADYIRLAAKAEIIYKAIPGEYRDAYLPTRSLSGKSLR